MFSLFYVNASFLQYAKGFTVIRAGLGIVPMTLPMVFDGRFAWRLSLRIDTTATSPRRSPSSAAACSGCPGLRVIRRDPQTANRNRDCN